MLVSQIDDKARNVDTKMPLFALPKEVEMGMGADDVEVGIVNSFRGEDIREEIERNNIKELQRKYGEQSRLPDGRRPFVCVGHKGGVSQWAEITTQKRKERLRIDDMYRSRQCGIKECQRVTRWETDVQYIHGAIFQGSDVIWASLAQDSDDRGSFKIVTPEGLSKIREHLEPQLHDSLYPCS